MRETVPVNIENWESVRYDVLEIGDRVRVSVLGPNGFVEKFCYVVAVSPELVVQDMEDVMYSGIALRQKSILRAPKSPMILE